MLYCSWVGNCPPYRLGSCASSRKLGGGFWYILLSLSKAGYETSQAQICRHHQPYPSTRVHYCGQLIWVQVTECTSCLNSINRLARVRADLITRCGTTCGEEPRVYSDSGVAGGDPGRISRRSLAPENWSPWAIVRFYLRDPTFSRFSRTPICDGQTDRHRPMASTADA